MLHFVGRMLAICILGFLSCPGFASDLISGKSYEISLQGGYQSDIDVLLTTSGPLLVLSGSQGRLAYDGKDGTPIRELIPSEQVKRPLGFVPANEVTGLLARLGCGQVSPGCTSPEDADFVLKVENLRGAMHFTYLSLEALRERFFADMAGEAGIQFDQDEQQVISELVSAQVAEGRWSWREGAVDKIQDIRMLDRMDQARENLRQFSFAEDGRLLARRSIGSRVIEQSFADLVGQHTCRLLAGAIVREFPRRDISWLGLALGETMLKQCAPHSVQFRFGLFDGPREERNKFSEAIKKLACINKPHAFSEDYWCASQALTGKTCENHPLQCGGGPVPARSKPELPPDLSITDVPENERLSLFEFREVGKMLQRDVNPLAGVSFPSLPPEKSKDGRFRVHVQASERGGKLMKEGRFAVRVRVILEVVRKDSCTSLLGCPFRTTGEAVRRAEKRVIPVEVDRKCPGDAAVDFRDILPREESGLRMELLAIRLTVDRIVGLEALPAAACAHTPH